MGSSPIVKFEVSTVEMLQNTKTAPVSAGLNSFVGVARSGEGYKIAKVIVRRTTRGYFFFSCCGFCRSFIFNKLPSALLGRSAALEIS